MKRTILLFSIILICLITFGQSVNNNAISNSSPEFSKANDVSLIKSYNSDANQNKMLLNNPQRSRGIPASPYSYTKVLPDGRVLELKMRGDGVVHWEETIDGYTVIINNAGFYVYAAKDKYNSLVATNILVNNITNRTSEELEFLATTNKNISFSKAQIEAKNADYYASQNSSKNSAKSFPTTGTRKLVTILVRFPDKSFTRTQSEFNNLFNSSTYSLEGATGSIKKYFSDNSFSQLDLTTDVFGPYTLPNNMAYYGGNDGDGDDLRPREMISDAIALANPDVDFSDYDNDGDGKVDGVYIIYAGYSEASGGPANAIWPHRWALPYPGETYDGVTVYDYACSNELYGSSGTSITGIGTICHEFGHNCGLPDFYDTDYAGSGGDSFTLGGWDVMDGGSYNNYGMTPPFYNAYSRDILGWQTPTLIQSPVSVTLPNSSQNNVSYYYTTQTAGEYYILENRQKISWDAYIPHHGMLVYHVDMNYISSHSNTINTNPTHQGFDIVEADNVKTEGSRTGDSFPGATSKTSFTDATTPSSKSWANQNTNKPITAIQEISQIIYFNFMGGAIPAVPVANFVADQTSVLVGSTVNFVDLSTGVPNNYTWTFNGGTPSTSTNPNPSIVYNTPGTYSVVLYVSNTFGNNTITKTDYITVTSAPITCEYADNIETDDDIVYYISGGGYLTGPNSNTFTEFAEHYTGQLNNLVTGAQIGVLDIDAVSTDAKITMKIWSTTAGKPGTVLYSEDFDIADFTEGGYNEITFATPTTVPSDFFIGYQIYFTTPQDTFAVYQVQNRGTGSTVMSTAFLKKSGTWRDLNVYFGGLNTAFCIYPNICPSPPTANFSANVTSGCGSLSVTFTNTSSSNADTFSWDFGDGSSTSSDANPIHTYENPGVYTVVLTATNTMGDNVMTKTNYITVGETPGGIVVSGGGTQCGGTVTLTASGGSGGTIYWQNTTNNGTSTTTASSSQSVSVSGTYYFRAKSTGGCWGSQGSATVTINSVPTNVTVTGGGTQCGGTMTLTATGGTGGTIYWQNTTENGTSTATASSTQVISTSGTYYFRSQSAEGCWSNQGSATVIINAVPTAVSVSGGGTQCGGTMTLTATGGTGGIIYWQNTTTNGTSITTASSSQSVSASGTYYFRAKSTEGCWGTQGSDDVVIYPAASVDLGDDQESCGEYITFDAGPGFVSYVWNGNPYNQTLEVGVSGDYTVVVTDNNGCTANDVIHVDIWEVPYFETSTTPETSPSTMDGTANVNVMYVSGPEILWSNDETTETITGLAAGYYSVTVTNTFGCTASETVFVPLEIIPVAAFSASQTLLCDEFTVNFTDESLYFPSSWQWDFGDGSSTSSDAAVEHTYSALGSYTVSLTVTNDYGTDEIEIENYIVISESPVIAYETVPTTLANPFGGEISTTVSGGSEPYTIEWGHDSEESSLNLTGLEQGNYYLTVTENAGCLSSITISVELSTSVSDYNCEFKLYPNPASSFIKIEFSGEVAKNIELVNAIGEIVFTTNNTNSIALINLEGIAPGAYFINLKFANRAITRKIIID